MLVLGSTMMNKPVLSLHTGTPIAMTTFDLVDPENLHVIAYGVDGPAIKNDPELGNILDVRDIRENSPHGVIVNSSDVFVNSGDVIQIDKVADLNFDLIGLKVVTKQGKKLGKIVDYTIDSESFMIYQLIVQKPMGFSALNDPQLTINRSQIVEIDDYQVIIKNDKQQVKVVEKRKPAKEDFQPNFVNPFRKPTYAPDEADVESDSASTMSE